MESVCQVVYESSKHLYHNVDVILQLHSCSDSKQKIGADVAPSIQQTRAYLGKFFATELGLGAAITKPSADVAPHESKNASASQELEMFRLEGYMDMKGT